MWSEADIGWLKSSYSTLKVVDYLVIEGWLPFSMIHTGNQHIINPSVDILGRQNQDLYIFDQYKVRLQWVGREPQPRAFEIGGRIARRAENHVNGSGELCLAAPGDIEAVFNQGYNLQAHIMELLIPYLYAQSYARQHEGQWPWGELAHGSLGLLEWLARRPVVTEQDIGYTYRELELRDSNFVKEKLLANHKGHHPCFCGSSAKSRSCHPDAWKGAILVRNWLGLHP